MSPNLIRAAGGADLLIREALAKHMTRIVLRRYVAHHLQFHVLHFLGPWAFMRGVSEARSRGVQLEYDGSTEIRINGFD